MLVNFDNNIQQIKLDVTDHVELKLSSDNDDNTLIANFTFEQLDTIIDEYRAKIGEPTFEKYEKEILELQLKVEDLQEIIEMKENEEQFKREQYIENEIF